MNNTVFRKTMENPRTHKHRCININTNIVCHDRKKNCLVLEPNYHSMKWISEKLRAIELNKAKVKMNKPVNLGLQIPCISKTALYAIWIQIVL